MTEVVSVALGQIRLNDYNPNAMDTETFNALLKDMGEGSPEAIDPILLRPLEVTGADAEAAYEVVDGEHRTRAALRLGWTEIRARIREMGLEEAMVVNYRKNRERGRLDSVKEGRLYKWWRDEKGLTQKQIGAKFDVTQAHVSVRIGNVENVEAEAIQVLRERVPSTDGEYKALYTQPELKEKSSATKKTAPGGRSARREEPIEATKLDMLGSINIKKLLERSRLLKDLDEDIPEDVRMIEGLRERYGDKVRSLQLEVAGEIREKSFREAEAYVAERWGALVEEAFNERRDRERRALKAKLEKSGTIAVLQEDRHWTHRDRLTEKGKVHDKCLINCPQPAVMITNNMQTEEICANGACRAEIKEELEAETRRKAEEANRRLTEAREKIIKAGEAGDQEWLRPLLFLLSLNRDTRPSYLEQSNFSNRWTVILGMTMGQVVGKLLALVADCLVRPRREDDEVDFLQMLNWLSKTYGIDRDYLLWEPEEIQDVKVEATP